MHANLFLLSAAMCAWLGKDPRARRSVRTTRAPAPSTYPGRWQSPRELQSSQRIQTKLPWSAQPLAHRVRKSRTNAKRFGLCAGRNGQVGSGSYSLSAPALGSFILAFSPFCVPSKVFGIGFVKVLFLTKKTKRSFFTLASLLPQTTRASRTNSTASTASTTTLL